MRARSIWSAAAIAVTSAVALASVAWADEIRVYVSTWQAPSMQAPSPVMITPSEPAVVVQPAQPSIVVQSSQPSVVFQPWQPGVVVQSLPAPPAAVATPGSTFIVPDSSTVIVRTR